MGFAPPRFIARGCEVVGAKVLKASHLSLTLAQGKDRADAIAFGQGHHAPPRGSRVDVVFVPQLDVFRGVIRVKMHVQRLWRSL